VGTTAVNATSFDLSGLDSGGTYDIILAAFRGTVESVGIGTRISTQQDPDSTPHAPGDVAVQPTAPSALTVSWTDTNAAETGYEVERSVASEPFRLVGTTPQDGRSFTDSGLAAGTTYFYRVRAVKDSVYSDYSATASGVPTGEPPPPPEGWMGSDVGSTGSTGSDSGAPPAVTMNAGGTDIFGTADGFHGVFTSATGDMTIVARVASMTNTHPWAKAGVMIRASLDANAANAAMLLTADNVCVFQARATAGADTTSTTGGYFNAPYWVKVTRVGNAFSGYVSPDGATWTLVGQQDIVMSGPVYIGLAGCSHNSAGQTVISFDHVVKTTTSEPPPPPPPATDWTTQTWAVSDSLVTVASDGKSMTISGRSGDIWNSADSATFVYHSATGDHVMDARIDSLTASDPYAKGGLMFRVSTAATAMNFSVVVTPTQGISFQVRQANASFTSTQGGAWGLSAPVWLRLGRSGNEYFAAYSLDERATWITLGTWGAGAADPLLVGIVGSSHNPNVSSTLTVSGIIE
jgi:regulation of enolase protein 1 (concanavalin A-like superfamily)